MAPLVFLTASDVAAAMPPIAEQLLLVRQTFGILASHEAQMPPKVGVYPRPNALIEAMPAWWAGSTLAGVKWVSAYPENRARGLDHIQGLIALNDADTGEPIWVMDARGVTAARTAAVSAYAIQTLAPPDNVKVTAVLGAGAQARAHVAALLDLGIGAELRVYDRHPDRAEALAHWVRSTDERYRTTTSVSAREAILGADVCLSCAALGAERQQLSSADVASVQLIVAIDDDVHVSSDIVATSRFFVVDDRAQFLAFRSRGQFSGFREPDGELATAQMPPPAGHGAGPAVAIALGIGLTDLVFAIAVSENARARGLGTYL